MARNSPVKYHYQGTRSLKVLNDLAMGVECKHTVAGVCRNFVSEAGKTITISKSLVTIYHLTAMRQDTVLCQTI